MLDEELTSVKSDTAESSAGERGPVTSHFKTIAVLDGNGDQLTLYEIRDRASLFGFVTRKRLELCTGEPVKAAAGGFVVVATGEKLTRVRPRR